ncbi:MAG: hypothetical protein ACOYBS_02670 [Flavobacterium sp.]
MKKIVLLLVCFVTIIANAQKISKNFLVGKWASETNEIEFSIENKKELRIVDFSTLPGNYFNVVFISLIKDFFKYNS